MVIVKRAMVESTPVIIFAHELAILQSIHGDDLVTIVSDPMVIISQTNDRLSEAEREFKFSSMFASEEVDINDEYARLISRYGMHSEINVPVVEYVYGRSNSPQWRDALKASSDEFSEVESIEDNYEEEEKKKKRPYNKKPKKIEYQQEA